MVVKARRLWGRFDYGDGARLLPSTSPFFLLQFQALLFGNVNERKIRFCLPRWPIENCNLMLVLLSPGRDFALQELSQENPKEVVAAKTNLSNIGLDGEIGCMAYGFTDAGSNKPSTLVKDFDVLAIFADVLMDIVVSLREFKL